MMTDATAAELRRVAEHIEKLANEARWGDIAYWLGYMGGLLSTSIEWREIQSDDD